MARPGGPPARSGAAACRPTAGTDGQRAEFGGSARRRRAALGRQAGLFLRRKVDAELFDHCIGQVVLLQDGFVGPVGAKLVQGLEQRFLQLDVILRVTMPL